MNEYFQKDINDILQWTLPRPSGQFASSLVRGYPTFGADIVIDELISALNDNGYRIADLSISEYLLQPVSDIIATIGQKLQMKKPLELHSFTKNYIEQVESGVNYAIILRNFDKVLKFKSEKYDQFHVLLDRFQVMGTNSSDYRTIFIVESIRNIDSICKSYNYSEFYKIFGDKRYPVRPRTGKTYEMFLRKQFGEDYAERFPLLAEEAGGSLGLAEILHDVYRLTEKPSIADKVERLRPIFDEFMEHMEVNNTDVLNRVFHKQDVEIRYNEARRNLKWSGMLLENEKTNLLTLFSNLFGHYLNDATPVMGKFSGSKVCIRKRKELSADHLPIFENLFSNYFYLEYDLLQSLPDQAYVYRIDGEDDRGQRYRPVILKIHTKQKLEKEIRMMEEAVELLGSTVPRMKGKFGKGALLGASMEFASSDNRNYTSQKFEEYYLNPERSNQSVAEAIDLTLENLWGLYKNRSVKKEKLRSLLFPPREDEFPKLKELIENCSLFEPLLGKFEIKELKLVISSPVVYLRDFSGYYFDTKTDYRINKVHGDLNVGNFMVDGIGQLHIIDFSTLRDGIRFTDHTRLETEIRLKLARIETREDLVQLILLESIALQSGSFNPYETLLQLCLSNGVMKQLTSIERVRRKALDLTEKGESTVAIEEEYLLCLLSQTLRLALFENYLHSWQREFALIYSSMLFEKLGELRKDQPQYHKVVDDKIREIKKNTYVTPLLTNLHDIEYKLRLLIMACIDNSEDGLVSLVEQRKKDNWLSIWRHRSKPGDSLIQGSTFRHKKEILTWCRRLIPNHIVDKGKFIRHIDLINNLLEDRILDDRNDAFHATLYSKSEKELERMLDNTKTMLHILDENTDFLNQEFRQGVQI